MPVWVVAVVAVIAGLGIGRFLTYAPPPAPPPPATAPGSPERIATLEQQVAIDPSRADAWQELGFAYLAQAFRVGDPSFYGLAEQAFARTDELVPSDPRTLLGQGALALALHQFPEALELGRRVTEALPSSPDALAVLVDAEVELGRYDDAAASLQDMLDLRPGLPALARTSYLRELHGDMPGAIEAMTRAEAAGAGQSFESARVAALLGTLHFRQGDLDAAGAAFDRALAGAPGIVPAEIGRARVLAAEGDLEAAVDVLQAVVERFPAPEAVVLLGDLQTRLGLEGEAAETYALVRAIAALQEEAGQIVELEMAIFEADQGEDLERALALARAAHEVRPDNVYANDALAWALLRSGDAAAAVAPTEEALRLGTTDPLVRYHAAEVFLALGDVDRARAELTRALDGTSWFSFRHHDRVLELADQLGVVPADA